MLFYWIHSLNKAYSYYSHFNVCLSESLQYGRTRPSIQSAIPSATGAHV